LQISGVSLTLTWPRRLCLFRVLLGVTATVISFPLSKHTRGGGSTPSSPASVFINSSHGKCPFPLYKGAFLTQPLLQAFPRQGCWAGATTPAFFFWLVYLQLCVGLPLPHSSVLRASCPLCCMSFLLLLFIIQFVFFLFFPSVGVNLSRGLW
jgi:hypothetical protein